MAAIRFYAVVLAASAVGASAATAADEPVELREAVATKVTTRVRIELKAKGLYLPSPPPGASKGEVPKPLALKVESRLEFLERPLKADGRGRPSRSVRRVVRAASAVNGDVRPFSSAVRGEVALLAAEARPEGVVVFSPLGPLTRPELEVVQGPADPLALGGLLPTKAVKPGDRWPVDDDAARSLSAYDTLIKNGLDATLESVDAGSAKVRIRGEVRGSVLGGEGSIACDGWLTFDRKAGRVDALSLERAETRRPGPVEEGLDVKSTLTLARSDAETPPELTDEFLARWKLEADPERERLLMVSPDGKYTLRHDREWHTYWDDTRLTVLKRVENGRLVVQCNLAAGPNAGKGRHQDLSEFRDHIRKGLGDRFGQFLGEGEVPGDPDGGFRYKIGAQGRQGDVGVVWYYYLIAGPDGDQLLATFTMAESEHKTFGDRDEALVGSLRWKGAGTGAAGASATPRAAERP